MHITARSVLFSLACSQATIALSQELEEVVVTGHWGETALQDTPVAASVFDKEQLRTFRATDIHDISGYSPNLQVVPTIGGSVNAAINIRGAVTTTNNLSRDTAVSVYLNGVPIGKTSGAIFDAVDLERIEVLRGPQGTQYGRNTIGGAINLVTQAPGDEFSANVEATAGNKSLAAFRAGINLPVWQLTEDLELTSRVSLFSRNREGFVINTGPSSKDYDDRNQWGARFDAALNWQDTFILTYGFDHFDARQTPTAIQPISRTGSSGVPEVDAAIDAQTSTRRKLTLPNDSSFHSNVDIYGHALTAEYLMPESGILGDVTLRSISAYRELTTESASDFDGTALDVFRFILDNDFHQFTQELQWLGETDQVNYVFGVFYYRDSWSTYNPRWLFQFGGNQFDTDDRSAVDYSAAAYTQVDWTPNVLGDALTFSFGLRYSYENKDVTRLRQDASVYEQNPQDPEACVCLRDANGNPVTRSGNPPAGAPASDLIPLNAQNTWSDTTWLISMQYQINHEVNAYAKASTGFTSGGYNGVATTNQTFLMPFDPEKVLTYEIGVKSSLLDGLLEFDTAVFYNDFTDLQASVIEPDVLGIIVENAADANTTGIEMQLQTYFAEGFNVFANYAYLYTRYNRFDDNGVDVSNDRTFAYSPSNNVSTGVSYTLFLGNAGNFVASTNYRWTDDQWIDTTRSIEIASYGLWDTRLALNGILLDPGAHHTLDIAVWGANLTNASYIVTGIDFGFAQYATFGDPVSFGVDVAYRFQ